MSQLNYFNYSWHTWITVCLVVCLCAFACVQRHWLALGRQWKICDLNVHRWTSVSASCSISCSVHGSRRRTARVVLPQWLPMTLMMRTFCKDIERFVPCHLYSFALVQLSLLIMYIWEFEIEPNLLLHIFLEIHPLVCTALCGLPSWYPLFLCLFKWPVLAVSLTDKLDDLENNNKCEGCTCHSVTCGSVFRSEGHKWRLQGYITLGQDMCHNCEDRSKCVTCHS